MDEAEQTTVTALELGLKRCHYCGRLQKIGDESVCARCGAVVSSRRHGSLQKTWAFLLVGIFAYIPANVTPIMITQSFAGNERDTIMSGVFSLISTGSYFVAIIVFVASICIPVLKFIIVAALALSLQFHFDMTDHTRHRLHTLIELIGRWSMIDVFVVAVLAALIQLGAIITITPGIAINTFAVSVLFTMLAASSLDRRLLWDD